MTRVSVRLKTLSNVPPAAVCSSETTDCSYVGLMKHLNLTSNSELSIMRPVRHWRTSTIVVIDMLLDSIVEVVSVWELLRDAIPPQRCLLMARLLVFTTVLIMFTGREVSKHHKSHFCLHGRKMSRLVQL